MGAGSRRVLQGRANDSPKELQVRRGSNHKPHHILLSVQSLSSMDPYLRNVFTGGESTDERPATCISPILKALTQDPAKGVFTPAAHHASLTASPSLDRSTLELTRSLTSVLSTSGSSPTPAVLPLITRAVTSLEHMYGIFTTELRRLALLPTSDGGGGCPPLTLPYSLATEA